MKLIEAIKNVDRSEENCSYANTEDFGRLLGLDVSYNEKFEGRVKKYWIQRWLCTDTWVGLAAYYMDGEAVAVSTQLARKSDEEIKFLSKESAIKVRDFLYQLMEEKEEHVPPFISSEELEEDLGTGYTVEYASQLLDQEAMWKDQKVKIVKRYGLRYEYPAIDWHKVDVQTPDGVIHEKISLEEIILPYLVSKQ